MSVVLVEAKKEYTEQIVGFLRPAIFDDFFVMWRAAVDKNIKEPMVGFQELLETIVDWDEKMILRKTDAVVKKSGCSFLDDLITAVFVAHMKVMLSVKNRNQKDKYRLQVPTANRFIHQTMVQCAREFWKAPYLFYQNETENKIKKTQVQMNLRTAEEIISDSIRTTIRKMLPVKEIVGDVLEYDENGELIVDIEKRVNIPESDNDEEETLRAPMAQQSTAPATPVSGPVPGPVPGSDIDKQNIVQQLQRFETPVVISMEESNEPETTDMTDQGQVQTDDDDDSEYEGEGFIMGPIDDEIQIISDDTKTTQDKDDILGGMVESL